MKIELKLTADELLYLDKKIVVVQGVRPQELPKEKRTACSIMIDVSDKVLKSAKALSRSLKLFDTNKKNKITLKWHEAQCLADFLPAITTDETDPYKANMARKIITQLDQKLV